MNAPAGKRDVTRLRTFADDAELARAAKGISKAEAMEAMPKSEVAAPSGVLFSVKKKDLNLKDDAHGPALLSEDGVTFDEAASTKVVTSVYEENQAIKDDAKQKAAETVNIRQTDAVDVTTKPTPTSTADAATPRPVVTVPKPGKFQLTKTEDGVGAKSLKVNLEDESALKGVSISGASGEFVTDKKRDRFKLVPAVGEAMSDWFSETKAKVEEAQREKHTIAPIEKRVETIQAAAQAKTIAPTEDFAAVAERLKETKKTVDVSTPILVKPKEEAPKASWTHIIGEENNEAEAAGKNSVTPSAPVATTAPVTPVPVAAPAPITPPVEPTPIPAPVAAPIPTTPPAPAIPNPMAETPAVPTFGQSQTPEAISASPADNDNERWTNNDDTALDLTPTPKLTTPVRQPVYTAEVLEPSRPTTREYLPSPLLAIVVVVIAIISGVGTSLYFFWQPEAPVAAPTVTTNPLFTAEFQAEIAISENHQETMSRLLATVAGNRGSLYLYLTREGNNLELITPLEIMNRLAAQVPGSFARSVTNISFGAQDTEPFMVIRTNNFDSAFAGMLAWEQTMSADLAPLFGPVVTESFDPQARTDSQTRSAYFKDVVINNQSARVLTNATGEDSIIYTFINKQTVIIATDRLELTKVIDLVR